MPRLRRSPRRGSESLWTGGCCSVPGGVHGCASRELAPVPTGRGINDMPARVTIDEPTVVAGVSEHDKVGVLVWDKLRSSFISCLRASRSISKASMTIFESVDRCCSSWTMCSASCCSKRLQNFLVFVEAEETSNSSCSIRSLRSTNSWWM